MVRRRATSPEVDSIDVELIAIGVIGKALTPLDAEARIRVLRWVKERFQTDSTVPVPALAPAEGQPPVPALQLAPEPGLTFHRLDDLFEVPADLSEQPATLFKEPAEPPATLPSRPSVI